MTANGHPRYKASRETGDFQHFFSAPPPTKASQCVRNNTPGYAREIRRARNDMQIRGQEQRANIVRLSETDFESDNSARLEQTPEPRNNRAKLIEPVGTTVERESRFVERNVR